MIYCDHNATTAVHPKALDAMLPFLRDEHGNPSSVHRLGSRARCAVEEARLHVAALIGARPREIVFTSGGTESNHLAIHGIVASYTEPIVVTTAIEHASVCEAVAGVHAKGGRVIELPVDRYGRVDPLEVEAALRAGAHLVSVGWANNELGTVQPIPSIAQHCRRHGVWLHSDAVQAVGKIPVSVEGIDLMSISAHKLGGPKGVGALYVREGVPLVPWLRGGGQERGRRAGTENVAGIVGMGTACRLAAAEMTAQATAWAALRDGLWAGVCDLPGAQRLSPAEGCLPNTLCMRFDGVRGEALVAALDLVGVAVSAGSACTAGAGEPSHVLRALGLTVDQSRDGIRFSFGRGNSADELPRVVAALRSSVMQVRLAHRHRAVA
jgi:cysteine desulfurase